MNNIICEATLYYGLFGSRTNTFRIMFRMKDKVNGYMLQLATAQAFKRHPYYAVRCVSDGKEYNLESNSEPLVVYQTSEPVILGGADVNGYLLAVSYWEDIIWVNVFHGLTDATGLMNFSRTLLYYYCCERYDYNLPSDGVRVNDGTIPQKEWDNPYVDIMNGKRALPDEEDILVKVKPDSSNPPLNLFDDPRITPSAPRFHNLRISEKQLMQYCRAQDGTPGVVISLLMSRAIDRLFPDNDLPIVTGMAVNLRPALEAPDYAGSPLTLAYLPYSGKIRNKSFDEQATMYRGRLILAADKERLQAGIKSSTRLYRAIDQQPTVEAKCAFVHRVLDSYRNAATVLLSYVGSAKLAAMDSYVTELYIQNDCPGLNIEITNCHGFFFLNISHEWKEDIYFDAFCEELTAQGIDYEIMGEGNYEVPGISLP
ncbi:MAG: hypothetical protein ACI4DX_16870 [Oliverpabstia sp.]|nr:hypothetical protein [Eubacterium sp.]